MSKSATLHAGWQCDIVLKMRVKDVIYLLSNKCKRGVLYVISD